MATENQVAKFWIPRAQVHEYVDQTQHMQHICQLYEVLGNVIAIEKRETMNWPRRALKLRGRIIRQATELRCEN